MMRAISRTSQFKKDAKRMKRRGKDLDELGQVVEELASGRKLGLKHRDHMLVGGYRGTRECHIAPDWLLIYELSASEVLLIRTGTHADLFE